MVFEADLNLILSNVINENNCSHCRLCLKETLNDFVRFEDCVSYDPVAESYWRLSDIMTSLLGDEVTDVIPGVDAVCTDCMEKLIQCYTFIGQCKESTNLLNKIFTNLMNSLNVAIQPVSGQQLYVVVGEHDSNIMLMDGQNNKKTEKPSPKYKKSKAKTKKFNCKDCDLLFVDFTRLKNHNFKAHGAVTCEKCMRTFTEVMELDFHRTKEHGFKCIACDQYKDSEESLKEHFDRSHQPHMCPTCGKTYNGLDRLRAHELKHQSAKNCPKCGKNYVVKETFEKHVQLCLENRIEPHPFRNNLLKIYTCSKCGKGYSTTGGLRVHERFVHGNAKPHVCEYCGKKFTAPSYLRTHLVTHTGEKNFKCDICNRNLVSKEALLYHKRRHMGLKPYSCKLCSEHFVNASARAEHIKFKHTGPTLTCDICSHKFFTRSFLRQHMSKHHDPYSKLYIEKINANPNLLASLTDQESQEEDIKQEIDQVSPLT